MIRTDSRICSVNDAAPAVTIVLTLLASSIVVFFLCLKGFSSYVLLLPVALCCTVVMARSAGWAIVGFTIIIYMNTPAVLADSHGLRVFGDLVALLMLITVVYHFLHGKRLDQIIIPLVVCSIYLISLAATALYARNPDAVLGRVVEGAKICSVTILLISMIHSIEQFQRMCVAIVIAATLTSTLTVIQSVHTGYSNDFGGFALANVQHVSGAIDDWRPSGPLTDPNFYAQILVIALPLALQIMVSGANWRYALFGLLASDIISVALLLTFSRGGLIGAAASLLAIAFFNRQLLTKKNMLIVVLAGGVGLLAMPSHYLDRFRSGFNSLEQISAGGFGEDRAIAGRASELLAATHLAGKNPFLGVGYGEFKSYYQEISVAQGLMARGADREAHSLYLEILSERGLVGFSFFAALMALSVVSIRSAISHLRKQKRVAAANAVSAWGAAVTGYLATSTFLHEGYAQYFWLLVITALMLPALAMKTSAKTGFRDKMRV